MALESVPPGRGGELGEYCIRFEGSMYGDMHATGFNGPRAYTEGRETNPWRLTSVRKRTAL